MYIERLSQTDFFFRILTEREPLRHYDNSSQQVSRHLDWSQWPSCTQYGQNNTLVAFLESQHDKRAFRSVCLNLNETKKNILRNCYRFSTIKYNRAAKASFIRLSHIFTLLHIQLDGWYFSDGLLYNSNMNFHFGMLQSVRVMEISGPEMCIWTWMMKWFKNNI